MLDQSLYPVGKWTRDYRLSRWRIPISARDFSREKKRSCIRANYTLGLQVA
jgi:hypothetical protein